jgi:hypothetical protein
MANCNMGLIFGVGYIKIFIGPTMGYVQRLAVIKRWEIPKSVVNGKKHGVWDDTLHFT